MRKKEFIPMNLQLFAEPPAGGDGDAGDTSATGGKSGAGWSGNAGTTVLTFKASVSEGSSRSYTASIRRRRPLQSAAAILLLRTLRLRNWSQMRRSN